MDRRISSTAATDRCDFMAFLVFPVSMSIHCAQEHKCTPI